MSTSSPELFRLLNAHVSRQAAFGRTAPYREWEGVELVCTASSTQSKPLLPNARKGVVPAVDPAAHQKQPSACRSSRCSANKRSNSDSPMAASGPPSKSHLMFMGREPVTL